MRARRGRRWPRLAWALGSAWALASAHAHGVRAGDLHIDHPYAVADPQEAGAACVHFRGLRNTGAQAEVLVAARSPQHGDFALWQRMGDGHWMVQDWAVGWVLPAHGEVPARHDDPATTCLRVVRPDRPWRDGERFDLVLRATRQGDVTVRVWVQTPRRR